MLFCTCEQIYYTCWKRRRLKEEQWAALRAVAILRLQEVPADPMWLASGKDFGIFGKFGLVFAPLFNLIGGLFLWKLAKDLEAEEECSPV